MSTDPKSQTMIELAHAMAAVACDDLDNAAGIVAAVHARLQRRSTQGILPGVPVGGVAPTLKADEARRACVPRLFAYWQVRCLHPQAKLTPERGRAIVARLKDGYTEAEVRKAIDGAAVAAFVSEDNGQRYDDLTLICRNGSKLESFMERGIKATGAIAVDVDAASPVEEQIANLRRAMAEYKKDGRQTEYDHAARELVRLMGKRGTQ